MCGGILGLSSVGVCTVLHTGPVPVYVTIASKEIPMRLLSTVGVLALVLGASFSSSSAQARPQTSLAKPLGTFTRVYTSNTVGLIAPRPTQSPSPPYTPQALHEKVQGPISLEVTVDASGKVRDAMVTKSLDAVFGMDEQAVLAASQWIFEPGRLNGDVVAVRMLINFEMKLH